MKGRYIEYLKFLRGVKDSTRLFPYSAFLLNFFPFFAMLIGSKLINSIWDFLFIVPFVLAMTAGFTYNTICDAKTDPEEKNSIKRGDISQRNALIITVFCLIIAVLTFIKITSSSISIILFLVYIFLWLAYSGLNIRFKESYLGPFIASVVLWAGGPLILLVKYEYVNFASLTLLLGVFLAFASREIRHVIIDYSSDLKAECRTFAVRMGLKWATIAQYLLLIIGAIFVSSSLYFYVETMFLDLIPWKMFILFYMSFYFVTVFFSYFLVKIAEYQSYAPYYLLKLLLLLFGCVMVNLSPIYTLLLLWASMSNKFP